MSKTIISLCIGVVAGFLLSFLHPGAPADVHDSAADSDPVASVECVCDMQRNKEFERALQVERDAQQLLLAEIDELQSEIERLAALEGASETAAGDHWFHEAWADLAADEEPVDRRQQLIDAGFETSRAEWILERESQLQLATLGDRGLADGQPLGYLESRLAARAALREEIGDFEYEQYLAGTGQSTAVQVTQVLPGSPAHAAGLQVGDTIVDYNGARVFNMIELADVARNGDGNGAVVVNIERKGAPMQLVLPTGPLGISGGKPRRY